MVQKEKARVCRMAMSSIEPMSIDNLQKFQRCTFFEEQVDMWLTHLKKFAGGGDGVAISKLRL